MFEDWLKDFPYKETSLKDYKEKITKFWRDAYNNFLKLFKHDL